MVGEPFSLFPRGAEMNLDGSEVTFTFPNSEDAIIFYEFMASFSEGEFVLYSISRDPSQG